MIQGTLYTDGGSRGNPGPAGIGVVLRVEGREPLTVSEYIGEATNNQAEYAALERGMREAKRAGVTKLTCYLDSELVVKQMKGAYRVKNPSIKPIYLRVKDFEEVFDDVVYNHVVRAKNKEADALVNQALDGAQA